MPNWCYNSITISHDDPAMIKRIVEHSKAPLQELIPCPHDPETSDKWYDWRIKNWGTKWDIELHSVYNYDDNTISCAFDSAWSPPIEAYNKLTAMGFRISALYREMGMGFAGRYESTSEGEIIEENAIIEFSSEAWAEDMSDELSDFLEDEYQNWLAYTNEEAMEKTNDAA